MMAEAPELIYLDYHATCPLDRRVLETMLPWLSGPVGNASSVGHLAGQRAARAVEAAREQVAALVGAAAESLVFTSGTTESVNLALRGAAAVRARQGRTHLVTICTEHRAVLDTARALEQLGFSLDVLPVDGAGRLDLGQVREVVGPQTAWVSAMAANNEIGTLHPLAEMAEICAAQGAWFHVDAAQVVGREPFSVEAAGADLVSFSAHKMGGPLGVGALYVRQRPKRVRLVPMLTGGGQELGLRPGTLNAPAIVGFGAAAELAGELLAAEVPRVRALRDRLWRLLAERLPGLELNGAAEPRLAGNLNVSVPGVEAVELIRAVPRVAFSATSACSTARGEGSHVIAALGGRARRPFEAVRFGLGRGTTENHVDQVADWVASAALALLNDSAPP